MGLGGGGGGAVSWWEGCAESVEQSVGGRPWPAIQEGSLPWVGSSWLGLDPMRGGGTWLGLGSRQEAWAAAPVGAAWCCCSGAVFWGFCQGPTRGPRGLPTWSPHLLDTIFRMVATGGLGCGWLGLWTIFYAPTQWVTPLDPTQSLQKNHGPGPCIFPDFSGHLARCTLPWGAGNQTSCILGWAGPGWVKGSAWMLPHHVTPLLILTHS